MDAVLQSTGEMNFDDGAAILQELRLVNFDGPSGAVNFNDDMNRVAGYDMLSSCDSGMQKIGQWLISSGLLKNGNTPTVGPNTPCKKVAEALAAETADEEAASRRIVIGLTVAAAALILLCGVARHCRNKMRTHYTTFLSHSKRDGGDSAAFIKSEFDNALLNRWGLRACSTRGKNFIDTESLEEINADTLVESVKSSKVFVLLLTKSLLSRPWCLVEIYTALNAGIPVVPVLLKVPNKPRNEYSFGTAAGMLGGDLESFLFDERKMQEAWGEGAWSGFEITDMISRVQTATAEELQEMDPARAIQTVATPTGGPLTLEDIQRELFANLPSKAAEAYNPQAAELVRAAEIAVIVKRVRDAMKSVYKEPHTFNVDTSAKDNWKKVLSMHDPREVMKLRDENAALSEQLALAQNSNSTKLEQVHQAVTVLVGSELTLADKPTATTTVQSMIGDLISWVGWGGAQSEAQHRMLLSQQSMPTPAPGELETSSLVPEQQGATRRSASPGRPRAKARVAKPEADDDGAKAMRRV